MGWKTVATGDEAKAAHSKAMAEAVHIDGGMKAAKFGDAFKKSWTSGPKVLPTIKAGGLQAGVGALAGAGISMHQQGDVTAPFSLNGATTMGIGAASAVGGVMAWRFGKKLKTSIFTGWDAAKTAKQATGEILDGRAAVGDIAAAYD